MASTSPLPLATVESIGRAWTWTALGASGVLYDEMTFRSISNLPATERIVRLTAYRTGYELRSSRQISVLIPAGAQPLCFTRRAINTGSGAHEAALCLGFTTDSGERHMVWVTDPGDVAVSDRDLDQITS